MMVSTRRIGMLTPSSNTVLEPLTASLLADMPHVTAHFSRVRVTEISLEPQALNQFDLEPMLGAASLLADARVDAIVWNGTSGGWRGIADDVEICRRITERFGIPSTTVLIALAQLLRRFGLTQPALLTPYIGAVQSRILETFAGEGFACPAEVHLDISENTSFAAVSPETLDRMMASVAGSTADVALPFCTNLRALPHVERWEAAYGIPVFDSVAVAIRGGLDLIGLNAAGIRGGGRLFSM